MDDGGIGSRERIMNILIIVPVHIINGAGNGCKHPIIFWVSIAFRDLMQTKIPLVILGCLICSMVIPCSGVDTGPLLMSSSEMSGISLSEDIIVSGAADPPQIRTGPMRDLEISYTTYLGGTQDDLVSALCTDDSGRIYVAGSTYSARFISESQGNGDENENNTELREYRDLFVASLSSDGSEMLGLVFLGGSQDDEATAIAIDQDGRVVVAGTTSSPDFPADYYLCPERHSRTDTDGFLAWLSPDDLSPQYITCIGGSKGDVIHDIEAQTDGTLYLAGETESTDLPVVTPIQQTNAGGVDGFVCRVSEDGKDLIFSTYFGGSMDDYIRGITVGPDRAIYATGYTYSHDLPVVAPIQETKAGSYDAFVTKFAKDGGSILYSTYLGGTWGDRSSDLALEVDGRVVVTGYTYSPDFPVENASQPLFAGEADAFITQIDAAGTHIISSTFLGGSQGDLAWALALNDEGEVFIVGTTTSPDFPVVPAGREGCVSRSTDTFYAVFDTAGSLLGSGCIGGSDSEEGQAIWIGRGGTVLVGGATRSADFPVNRSLQSRPGGRSDGFVVVLNSSLAASAPRPTQAGGVPVLLAVFSTFTGWAVRRRTRA